MPAPVTSLSDFFPTYLARLEAGDTEALGLLYAENAVLTSVGGPQGDEWCVGRDQIVASLAAALKRFTIVTETPPTSAYELRGNTLAARFGTFSSTAEPKAGGPSLHLTVDAIEVLALSPTDGWRYLADQSRVTSITTLPAASSS
ncbi:MAG TPA: nuclear transport factor 2 family protein [Propionibacteriaceae bacterium]